MSIPTAQELWDSLAGGTVAGDGQVILQLVVALHQSNREQWCAEDLARAATDDCQVASAKRSIDELNGHRVRLIEEINVAYTMELISEADAPPLTSSPGATCDQLSVAQLRLAAVRDRFSGDVGRIREVETLVAGLMAAYESDVADVAGGRRGLRAIPIHKIYGS